MLIKKPFKKGSLNAVAPYYKTAGGGSLGLQTNCTGFWEFENTSWTDATGNGTTLTGVGSPTSVSGKVGNAASLGNSANALTASDNTNINSGGASFSVAVWVNGSPGSNFRIFNKDNNNFGNREWGLGVTFSGTSRWNFSCFNTGTTQFQAIAASGSGDFSSGWHHLVGTYNSSTKALVLYLDGAASGSGATLTGTLNSSASAPLNFGMDVGTISAANPLLVDQAGFWKGRILSSGDVTALYNGGSGLSWAAMA